MVLIFALLVTNLTDFITNSITSAIIGYITVKLLLLYY